MHNQASTSYFIQPHQLCIGLYIHLDLGWMDHPFAVSNFEITQQSQIDSILRLGLRQLRYDPKRSRCAPLSTDNVIAFPAHKRVKATPTDTAPPRTPANKQHALHQALQDCSQRFHQASLQLQQVQKLCVEHTEQALTQGHALVSELVSSTLTEGDIAIHAVHGMQTDDAPSQHALNTLVLCMMMAKVCHLSNEEAQLLGLAAIFHDIGTQGLSSRLKQKKSSFSALEATAYQRHVPLGLSMLRKLQVPERLLTLVAQHHERADGSGYPQGLQLHAIDPLSHILLMVNAYDELCHGGDGYGSPSPIQKTPYEALASMFSHHRGWFSEPLLRQFIKQLGVYPPGSLVRLSGEQFARVISNNPSQPLRPFVQLLSQTGHILDLRERPDLNIVQCLRLSQLPYTLQSQAIQATPCYFMEKPLAS